LKLVYFKTLDKFSLLSFEICEFNHFNQILLSLFDISSAFHNSRFVSALKQIPISILILIYYQMDFQVKV